MLTDRMTGGIGCGVGRIVASGCLFRMHILNQRNSFYSPMYKNKVKIEIQSLGMRGKSEGTQLCLCR